MGMVIGIGSYPDTAVEYEQALGRDLGGCSLFVQLLSDRPGRRLHGSAKTIVTAQLELAKSLNKTILSSSKFTP